MSRTNNLSAVFRVAGCPRIGFGHLRRCWTLADRLLEDHAHVRFVVVSHDARSILENAGLSVAVEEQPSSLEQLRHVLEQAPRPMVCVVDDPDLPTDGLVKLRQLAPIVCLDDTGARSFPVDLVVNGSAGADAIPYRGASDTRFLLGPQYILLRKSFAQGPKRMLPAESIGRILVLTGGGETGQLAREIVKVVMEVLPEATVDVVSGPLGPPLDLSGIVRERVMVHENPDDLRALMLKADLAVSGGGQTAYELAATATPTLGVLLAENQSINLRGLSDAGALRQVGPAHSSDFRDRLTDALRMLANNRDARREMGARGRCLVDGRGTERVATYLKAMVFGDSCSPEPLRSGLR